MSWTSSDSSRRFLRFATRLSLCLIMASCRQGGIDTKGEATLSSAIRMTLTAKSFCIDSRLPITATDGACKTTIYNAPESVISHTKDGGVNTIAIGNDVVFRNDSHWFIQSKFGFVTPIQLSLLRVDLTKVRFRKKGSVYSGTIQRDSKGSLRFTLATDPLTGSDYVSSVEWQQTSGSARVHLLFSFYKLNQAPKVEFPAELVNATKTCKDRPQEIGGLCHLD